MSGVARTSAAITVVNALPTGVGSAVGVALFVEARVRVRPEPAVGVAAFAVPKDARTALVEESMRAAMGRYFPAGGVFADLSFDSDIPVGRGLKSSSAVSTAILLAVARAARQTPEAIDVARSAAEVGLSVGVSATGALDDAIAGLEPGRFVTNNDRGEIILQDEVDPDLGVALYVPRDRHPPSPNLRQAFAAERSAGEAAVRAVTEGDWPRAMRLNTELVERAMGYSYGGLRERLETRGAVASGVSGLGPALAAVGPVDALDDLLDAFPSDGADRRAVQFTRAAARSWSPP